MVFGTYKGYSYAFGIVDDCPNIENCVCVDPQSVFGPRHVISSIMTAIDSYESGNSIARELMVELLVRLSGKRQISEALQIRKNSGPAVAICILKGSRAQVEDALKIALGENELRDVPERPGELDAVERRLLLV